MAGIYIHIPFCRQKCHYCNFFSVATTRGREEFLEALLKEISVRKDYIVEEEVGTVYFGGGTPSLLTSEDLKRIFGALQSNYRISDDVEITLEANPDDISPEWVRNLKDTPVNRLSIGVQSFYDEDLHYLNRVHTAGQAASAIELARGAGYENLTIDLIYGIPGLSREKWRKNLETFFSLSIPHLSAYALTVETKTALHHLIEKKKMPGPDEMESVEHFRLLQKMTREHGFVHYEISNFSLPGRYSRHNSIYWLGGNYLGLGPSAHSFNGRSRQWNVSGLNEYIRQAGFPEKISEVEYLSPDQRYNEYVMTSLRTMWGCDPDHILNIFGKERRDYFLKEAGQFVARNWLVFDNNAFYLTDEGKLFADGIASSFFVTGDE
jgi:oxygen-independent coproporphyrinogen III oxidase